MFNQTCSNISLIVLRIDITLLDITQLNMMLKSVYSILIDNELVILNGRGAEEDKSVIEQLPLFIADLWTAVPATVGKRNTLLTELQMFNSAPSINTIYKLKYILLPAN